MENYIGILTSDEKAFELIRLLHSSVIVKRIQDYTDLIFDKRCIALIVDSLNYSQVLSKPDMKISVPIIVYPNFAQGMEYLDVHTRIKLVSATNYSDEENLTNDVYMIARGVYFSIEQHCIVTPKTVHLLTNLEFRLLYILLKNKNRINSVEFLMEKLDLMSSSSLYVCIKKIRNKIEENPSKPGLLVNENKLGYRLNIPNINKCLENS